jgi:hypothetical protein
MHCHSLLWYSADMKKVPLSYVVIGLIVALIIGVFGTYLYRAQTTQNIEVDLVNGCSLQKGQVINTTVAGPTLKISVANKDAATFKSLLLRRGICINPS